MPYKDPAKRKAVKIAYWRKKYASDPKFRAKQGNRPRELPSRKYHRFNIDSEPDVMAYRTLTKQLRSIGASWRERMTDSILTVSYSRAHYRKKAAENGSED